MSHSLSKSAVKRVKVTLGFLNLACLLPPNKCGILSSLLESFLHISYTAISLVLNRERFNPMLKSWASTPEHT